MFSIFAISDAKLSITDSIFGRTRAKNTLREAEKMQLEDVNEIKYVYLRADFSERMRAKESSGTLGKLLSVSLGTAETKTIY